MFAVIHVTVQDDALTWLPAWLTLGVLITAAVVAWLQVKESRRLRAIQVRPYVDVDFDVTRPPMIYLVIRNTGSGRATDVQVTFDPPLKSSLDLEGDDRVASFVGHPWPSLVPGKRIETLFDSAIARLADASPFPLRYTVTVSYSAPDFPGQKFVDRYELDIGSYRNMHYSQKRGLDEIAKALDDLRVLISKWDHDGALDVVTTDRDRRDAERESQRAERWRLFQEAHAPATLASEDSPTDEPPSPED
jgi:hypothetical protein